MTFGLLNLAMLLGLIAVAIPPLIHLLNRRRHEVVDWGAMQFLQISQARQRRLLFEDLLLMLLRMGLIAVLVLALAAPYAAGPLIALLAERSAREVVLIFDGSYSMGLDDGKNPTPHERARVWAKQFLQELSPGDRVTILQTGQPMNFVRGESTPGLTPQEIIDRLPEPLGTGNGPRAVVQAVEYLQTRGQHEEQDVILLTDGQRFGWADPVSLAQWKNVATQLHSNPVGESPPAGQPRLWFVSLQPRSQADQPPPNFALAALRAPSSQVWAGHTLALKTILTASGQPGSAWPVRLRLEVDGKFLRYLPVPLADVKKGQVPLAFTQVLREPGSHLLSVWIEPDSSRNLLAAGHAWNDFLPADNHCDLAVVVRPTLPVLLVDGEDKLSAESSTFFLRKAFTEKVDPQRPPRVLTRAVPVRLFDPKLLDRDLRPGQPGSRPRVLILADVPRLSPQQQEGVDKFLERGGSVLVALGKRIGDPALYNERLYRAGQGWLPARLDRVTAHGDQPDQAAAPDVQEFHHPALETFAKQAGVFGGTKFPRYWRVQVAPGDGATTTALLTSGDPMLVEKPYKNGRVLLCAVPLDGSWESTLPRAWEYPVLVHQLVYYLASPEVVPFQVAPGQPLLFTLDPAFPRAAGARSLRVQRPDGNSETHPVAGWPFQYENTQVPGVYRLQPEEAPPTYYVVEPDRRESDLTPLTEQDRKEIARYVPVRYEEDPRAIAQVLTDPTHQEDLWWVLLLVVVLLLCLEIGMTRRLARERGSQGG